MPAEIDPSDPQYFRKWRGASPASRPDLDKHLNSMKGVFEDGLSYQKRLRDEW